MHSSLPNRRAARNKRDRGKDEIWNKDGGENLYASYSNKKKNQRN